MKLSVKTDYACRAIEALALNHHRQTPLTIDEIAEKESIPANYLVQILIELKGKGLIQSRRGKAGGYLLAKPPKDITLGEVVRAVQGEMIEISALSESGCPEEIRRAWRKIKHAAENIADNINFEQLCAEANGRPAMYYI
jgi:Rrf2 family cysteine metabolism transcriptional repressor